MLDVVGQLQPGDIAAGSLVVLALALVALIVYAIVVFVVAKVLDGRVQWLAGRMDLGEAVLETPLGVVFESPGEVEAVVGRTARYFVYLVGLLVLVGVSGQRALIEIVQRGARYVPSVLGALLIVAVGFVAAGYVARSIKASDVLGDGPSAVLATTVQVIVYFVVVTLALDALGYSTAILNTLAQAVAIGVGLGVALAIGIAVGMGSQDYVAEHVDEWLE